MSSVVSQLPKVNYIKLVDAWMISCVVFVFAAFLEFAVVYQLHCKERDSQKKYQVIRLFALLVTYYYLLVKNKQEIKKKSL